jgi:uncharacterized protein YigA (DUF484 family)
MTKQSIRGVDTVATSEEAVADYLQNHPDFFERNANVLARLRVPHERGVSTVSLVERQVLVLRDKNQKLESKVREFVDVARANDALSDKIHHLARRLIRARGATQLIDTLEASLREDFGASQWLLVLNRTDVPELKQLTSRHLRVVERSNAELKMFDTFFESARPRCGQVRDSQRDYLFGEGTVAIGSAALLPLGPNSAFGLLAIGSPDVDRFHPTMSTEFLARIGELVSEAVGGL